ncbi:MAG: DUF1990 domain-containing protein, partial [Gemmataceae bacterium]|nr:DUF1990 domain-containing protein [Gemmataceae bacterium]
GSAAVDLLLPGSRAAEALAPAALLPVDPRALAGPGPRDHRISETRVLAREAPGEPEPDGPFRRVARAILAYEVWPEWLMVGELSGSPLRAGDTFGNRVVLAGVAHAFFAGRVKECFDGPAAGGWRAGFTLQTVSGHPAVGEETIEARKDAATGEVAARISSWSRPADWWAWPGLPLMRWLQRAAVRGALARLGRAAAVTSPGSP